MIARLLTFFRFRRPSDDAEYDDLVSDDYLADQLNAFCEPDHIRVEREILDHETALADLYMTRRALRRSIQCAA